MLVAPVGQQFDLFFRLQQASDYGIATDFNRSVRQTVR
jgi:hypothetical protein